MQGVYTALVTPFADDNTLDMEGFKALLKMQRDAKVAGVIVCGTTGECSTLMLQEKKNIIVAALTELKNTPLKVIAGTTGNNTAESVELSKWAAAQKVAGILAVTPYYNKPSQAGLEKHFLKIADAVDCQTIVYNNPSRTGVAMGLPLMTRLAEHPRIRTIKDATGNIGFASEMITELSKSTQKIDILSGDDATFFPFLCVGGNGIISVASNLIPHVILAIWNHVESGELQQARLLHQRYEPLLRHLFIETNPVPIKAALHSTGIIKPHVRLPLTPLEESHAALLRETLAMCMSAPETSPPPAPTKPPSAPANPPPASPIRAPKPPAPVPVKT